jgi:DNA-binding CsgD family transcriptional regulator
MPRGRHTSVTIRLTPTQRALLEAWQRSTTVSAGLARRGRILLLVATGMPIVEVARRVDMHRRFVYKWVERFQTEGLAGLSDRAGKRGHHPRAAAPDTPAPSPVLTT